MAALKDDGSISTWGTNTNDQLSSPTGTAYTQLASTQTAYAALHSSGTIDVWGNTASGGTGGPSDGGYDSIWSNPHAFAALKEDGSITAWGNTSYGGSGAPTDTGYVAIASTEGAFAGIKYDGSITAWGDSSYGTTGAPTDSGYQEITSTSATFAALKEDGSITAWGTGNSATNEPTGDGYTSIHSTHGAFAALHSDGSISAWGTTGWGISGVPTDSGYVSITSSNSSFAALKADGSITAWGSSTNGGSGEPTDTGYTQITGSSGAFTALSSDGSVTSWGNTLYGSTGAPSDTGYLSVVSNTYAFAALKADGSVTAWGASGSGDTGEPTSGIVSLGSPSALNGTNCRPRRSMLPYLTGSPDTSNYQYTAYSFTPFGYDPEGGTLTYSIVNKPSWASFNTSTGALTGTPSAGDSGITSDITISVSNPDMDIATLPAFSLSVQDSPVIAQECSADYTGGLNNFGGQYNAPNHPPTNILVGFTADNSIVTWGYDAYGGAGEPTDSGYRTVVSTAYSMGALKEDGSISTWGSNTNGELSSPTGTGYAQLASAREAYAALHSDGTITAWGNTDDGGTGEPTDGGYQSISSNYYAFAALKEDGSISAWGRSTGGGTGAPSDSGYVAIASSVFAFAALKNDGSITAWGDSTYGGSGAPTDSGYLSISSNSHGFSALKVDGSINSWGLSTSGGDGEPTGDGFTAIHSTHAAFAALNSDGTITAWGSSTWGGSDAPTDSGWVSITSSFSSFAALKDDGSIISWGLSNSGGTGEPTDTGYTQIFGTSAAFTALKSDGSVTSWGNSSYGGTGAPTDAGYISIASNSGAFAALKADGSVTSWGSGNHGNTGEPSSGIVSLFSPAPLTGTNCVPQRILELSISGSPETSTYAASSYTFSPVAIDPTGGTLSFSIINKPSWASFDTSTGIFTGTPFEDDIGLASAILITVKSSSGTSVSLPAFDLTVIEPTASAYQCPTDFGGSYSYHGGQFNSPYSAPQQVFAGLTSDGQVISWGQYNHGGTGEPTDSGYVAVAMTHKALAAIKHNGSITAWGDADYGAVGAPTESGYLRMVSNTSAMAALHQNGSIKAWGDAAAGGANEPTDTGYTSITSADFAMAAIKGDGSITAWGDTAYGGSGAPNDVGYTSITAGKYAFAALKDDGTITAWGDSTNGGTGAPSDNGYVSISSNSRGFAALTANGAISAWGDPTYGGSSAPSDTGYQLITANRGAYAALHSNGSISTWGASHYGGDGVPSGNDFDMIYAGFFAFAALRNDGSITAWGDTASGGSGAPTESNYTVITGNFGAFAALNSDGTVAAWGGEDYGGTGAPTDAGYVAIASNKSAFAAIKGDGSVTAWGGTHSDFGTTGEPDSEIVSVFGRSASSIDQCTVKLDLPPTLSGTPNASVDQGSIYNFSPIGHDPDNGSLSFDIVNKPNWATFNTATGALTGTPNNNDVGVSTNIVISVTSSDSDTASLPAFSVTVNNVNDAPLVANAVPDQTTDEDTSFNFSFTANTFVDIDSADTLSYSITSTLPAWLNFAPATRTFNGTPGNADVGAVSVEISASDGVAATSDSFAITVNNVNDAPTVNNPLSDQSVTEDNALAFVVPANTFDDQDSGDTLSLSIISTLPAWLNFNTSTGLLSGTPANADVGDVLITVQADDGSATVSDSFTLTVINSNDAPTVSNPVPDQNAAEDSAFAFSLPANSFDDVDVGDNLEVTVSSALPSWLSYSSVSETFSGTPQNADVGGLTVTLAASDGISSTTDIFVINVANSNDSPTVSSPIGNQNATEDMGFVFAVPVGTFADQDAGDSLSYSLQSKPIWINFDAATNTLSGTPSNADVATSTVIVRATDDGGLFAETAFNIDVINENDSPDVNLGIADQTATEDQSFSHLIPASAFSDPDVGDTLTFSLLSGPAWLSLNTGTLVGTPQQADTGWTTVTVRASDGGGLSADTSFLIEAVEVDNSAPVFSSASATTTTENTSAVFYTAITSDVDSHTPPSYTLLAGLDSTLFVINSGSGQLSFNTPPDYESPGDTDSDNAYQLTLRATDVGGNSADLALTVSVLDLNDNAPSFTSAASHTVAEGSTGTGYVVTTTDADAADTVLYSVVGGADALQFSIDSSTGVLLFSTASDFESPLDQNGDNVYAVQLQATDSAGNNATLALSITLSDANDSAPVFSSASTAQVAENTAAEFYTATSTDPDAGDSVSYAVDAGRDGAAFVIDASTGGLRFSSPPDAEAPSDSDTDNTYLLDIRATDGASASTVMTLAVTVTDSNDTAPVFDSATTVSTPEENLTVGYTAHAHDPDQDDAAPLSLSYSISGGADAARFSVDSSTGALAFIATPDFESPADANSDNSYALQLTATDTGGNTGAITLTVQLVDTNDNAPDFSSPPSVDLNEQTAGVFYTATAVDLDANDVANFSILSGNSSGLFSIDGASGQLSTTGADFENPGSGAVNNVYQLVLESTDLGTNTRQFTLEITVHDSNDNTPVVTSSANVLTAENSTSTGHTITSTDLDIGDSASYAIVGGADQLLLQLSGGGLLSFNNAPDAELPADANADNSYELVVRATDSAGNFSDQSITVGVVYLNDNAPVFSSATSASIIEGSAASLYTALATDPDSGDSWLYSISGGADGALLSIDAVSGLLSFDTAPDADIPADQDSDNVYDIVLAATDNGSNTGTLSLSVTVADSNDTAPTFTSGASRTTLEGIASTGYTASASDPDFQDQIKFSISGGSDGADFSIDEDSGELSFQLLADFENPADADTNNQYDVEIQATDAATHATVKTVLITVSNVNDEAPVFGSANTASVTEGSLAAFYVVHSTDADPGDSVSYAIAGGADAGDFSLNQITGALNFTAAKDYESPADSDTDNNYQLQLRATDSAGNSSVLALLVSVSNFNEAPIVASQSFSVEEFSPPGTAIGTLNAEDPENDNLSWSLLNAGSPFSIDSAGLLILNSALDFELTPQYSVGIRVSDGNLDTVIYIQIDVEDQNEIAIILQERPIDITKINATGATGALLGREAYYERAADAATPLPSTVAQLQALIDRANATANTVELATSGATGNDKELIDALKAAGVIDAKQSTVAAYRAVIQSSVPQPTNTAELQALIDEANTVQALVQQANRVQAGAVTSGVLHPLVDGFEPIDEQLLGELAAAIHHAEPAPYSTAAINNIIAELIDRAQNHPVIRIVMQQSGGYVQRIRRDGGPVTLSAEVSNLTAGQLLLHDWSGSSALLLFAAGSPNPNTASITFEPTVFESDTLLTARVVVSHGSYQSAGSLLINFQALALNAIGREDDDSDGVSNSFEGSLESIANPEAANMLQSLAGDDIKYVMESSNSTKLRMGSLSRAADAQQGSLHFSALLAQEPAAKMADKLFKQPLQVLDFEISYLPRVGTSALLVFPLQEPLPTHAVYRKFHLATGWTEFVSDGLNKLSSAPAIAGIAGLCPPPGNAAYRPGLRSGDNCLQVQIEDGGPNDGDRLDRSGQMSIDGGLNGNIVDPGAIMQPANAPLEPGTDDQTKPVRTGLGSLGMPFLLFYLLLVLAHLSRLRCRR